MRKKMRRQYRDNLGDCGPATVEPAGHAPGQVSAFVVVAAHIAAAAVPNQDY